MREIRRAIERQGLRLEAWGLRYSSAIQASSLKPQARRFKSLFFLLALPAFVVLASYVRASEPQVVVEVDSQEIFIGENITYNVTVKNAETATAPDLSAFEQDFNVKKMGDRSSSSSSMQIVINGRLVQSEFSHIYGYQLSPKHSGILTIPAPFITVNGQKVFGNTLRLQVLEQEQQDLVLMEIRTSKASVFPTQPFDVTLRILIKPLPNGKETDPLSVLREPPHLEISWKDVPEGLVSNDISEWLGKFVVNDACGITINGVVSRDVFFNRPSVLNLYAGREIRPGLDGSKINYFVYELKRTFTPQKSGSYSFSVLLKGSFVNGVSGRRYSIRRLVLSAEPRIVETREVPVPRPPDFCGGIGNYNVSATAVPPNLRVGDPLTLTLQVQRQSGSGSLDLISAPNIAANEKLTDDFEIIERAPTGEVKQETKSFAYSLRPKRAGVSIPALSVTVFNPDSEKFVDMQTSPIELKVTAVTMLNAQELVTAVPAGRGHELHSRNQGIVQNISNPAVVYDQHVNPLSYILASVGTWGICGVMSILLLWRRRRAGDQAWLRRQRAKHEAGQFVSQALAAQAGGKADDVGRLVRAAIVNLIGNMLNLPALGMTAHEAGMVLSQAGVASEIQARVVSLLEKTEALDYGSSASLDSTSLLENTETVLAELHRELDKKR